MTVAWMSWYEGSTGISAGIVDLFDLRYVELWLAVVGHEAIDFLLDVG